MSNLDTTSLSLPAQFIEQAALCAKRKFGENAVTGIVNPQGPSGGYFVINTNPADTSDPIKHKVHVSLHQGKKGSAIGISGLPLKTDDTKRKLYDLFNSESDANNAGFTKKLFNPQTDIYIFEGLNRETVKQQAAYFVDVLHAGLSELNHEP